MALRLAAAASWLLLTATARAQILDVTTRHGPVRGVHDDQLHIRSFLGIPYGAVDKENRFKAPLLPNNWTEILETTEFTKICPQMMNGLVVGTENCLVLNVFAPSAGSDLPVLVHVHGGELQRGSAAPDTRGPQRLVPRGLVLVTPNYRLGPLGFLCLQSASAPGNAGLKDLRLALDWVRDNIQQFGGDPDRITVSGEGTGGGAAGLLAISPSTAHMTSKLIAESGSSLSPWMLDRSPVRRAHDFVNALKELHVHPEDEDEDQNENDELSAIKELDIAIIIETAQERNDIFKVCVESTTNNTDAFLTAPPYHLLLARKTNRTLAMIGYASGAGMREAAAQTAESMEKLESDYYSLLPTDLTFPSATSRHSAAMRIKSQYFGEEPITIEHRKAYMNYYTDAMYLGPTLRVARLLAADGSVFLYEFGYDGALNFAKHSLAAQEAGAARGDIVGYVFKHKDEPESLSDEDARMAEIITDLWSGFIIHGRPELAESGVSGAAAWCELSAETEHLLNITRHPPQPQQGAHVARLRLWDDLYATNYVDCPNTARPRLASPQLVELSLAALACIRFLVLVAAR